MGIAIARPDRLRRPRAPSGGRRSQGRSSISSSTINGARASPAVVLLLPSLAAAGVRMRLSQPVEAPFFARTVHPASPAEITFKDKQIDLDAGDNPYRELETVAPRGVQAARRGGAQGLLPRTATSATATTSRPRGCSSTASTRSPPIFNDQGTIPMLRETFLFWRIARGGPGMPDEGGPSGIGDAGVGEVPDRGADLGRDPLPLRLHGRRPRAKEESEKK